jgi:hypothetical protein
VEGDEELARVPETVIRVEEKGRVLVVPRECSLWEEME